MHVIFRSFFAIVCKLYVLDFKSSQRFVEDRNARHGLLEKQVGIFFLDVNVTCCSSIVFYAPYT